MSVTLDQSATSKLAFIIGQLEASAQPVVTYTLSEEIVSNPGGNWTIRFITWAKGADHFTNDLDATLKTPSVALVEVATALKVGFIYAQYVGTGAPPPPPPPPQDTIIDGPVVIVDGREVKTQIRPSDGKTRKCTHTPFGWSDTEWA